jgi:hypothetical protein
MMLRIWHLSAILLIVAFSMSCSTAKTSVDIPSISDLPDITDSYSVSQSTSTMISFAAPSDETITVYLYEPDGSPGFIIYQGSGGVKIVSLALAARENGYRLRSGQNIVVLVGPQGRAANRVNVQ